MLSRVQLMFENLTCSTTSASVLAGRQVADVDVLDVGTARRARVGEPASVGRRRPLGHGHRAVGGEQVRVDDQRRLRVEARLPVDRSLSLQAGVLREPQLSGLEYRQSRTTIVPQFRQALADRFALREAFEVGESDLVLGCDPGRGVGRIQVLEPAVRIRRPWCRSSRPPRRRCESAGISAPGPANRPSLGSRPGRAATAIRSPSSPCDTDQSRVMRPKKWRLLMGASRHFAKKGCVGVWQFSGRS